MKLKLIIGLLILLVLTIPMAITNLNDEIDLRDYKIINKPQNVLDGTSQTYGALKLSVDGNFERVTKQVESCQWKPDSVNDGKKLCIVELEYEDTNELESSGVPNLTFTHQNKNVVVVSTEISTEYHLENVTFLKNRTHKKLNPYFSHLIENYYLQERRVFTNYKEYIGKIPNEARVYSIRYTYEIPQYESDSFNPDLGACGTLNEAGYYTLNQSFSSGSLCILIYNSSITIDFAGHTITGNGSGSGISTVSSGIVLHNITIMNGELTNFSYGAIIQNASNVSIDNMSIYTSGLDYSNSYSVYLFGVRESSVSNSMIGNVLSTDSSKGIQLSAYPSLGYPSYNVSIYNNTINLTSNGVSDYVMGIDVSAPETKIFNNTLNNSGNGLITGMVVSANCTIESNKITQTGLSSTSILIANTLGATLKSKVFNNTINNYGENNSGITIADGSQDSIIKNNFLNASGITSNALKINFAGYGVRPNNSLILNNDLFATSYSITDEGNLTLYHYLVYNNSYGRIMWNSTNLTSNMSLEVGETIFLESNLTGLHATENSLQLNKTAQIKIFGLSYTTTPYLLKDGARCDNSSICNITNYDSVTGILIADVASFSNYSTEGLKTPTITNISLTPNVTAYANTTLYANATYLIDELTVTDGVLQFDLYVNGIFKEQSNATGLSNGTKGSTTFTGWWIGGDNVSFNVTGFNGELNGSVEQSNIITINNSGFSFSYTPSKSNITLTQPETINLSIILNDSDGDVGVVWYVDGSSVSTGESYIFDSNDYLADNHYNITAIINDSLVSSSNTWFIQVLQPEKIILETVLVLIPFGILFIVTGSIILLGGRKNYDQKRT